MAYIKKESIVEFITKGLNNPDKSKAYGYDAIEILTEIEYATEADVEEVKHGEWELTKTEFGWNGCEYPAGYTCSLCGYEHLVGAFHQYSTNYCPNCGAKMNGGAENEL